MERVSVIIPAHNEEQWLNRTIDNFLSTADGDVEVVVILNGYKQEVNPRAIVIEHAENMGERWAMNIGVERASGDYILRIDAHCDVDHGWDTKMKQAFIGRKNALVVPVLTAVDKQWKRLPGHWYGFCRLLPTMEEKWWMKDKFDTVEPNMAVTGCGMMMRKDWYQKIGGADESLPKMGAIGPEFAIKAHLMGDGVFTRTDVMLGHIFDTGGYDTKGVYETRKALEAKYGDRYQEIVRKFEGEGGFIRKKTTDNNKRTVTIRREDRETTKDDNGAVIKEVVDHFVYVYEDHWEGPDQEELERIYGPKAKFVKREIYLPDPNGKLVKVSEGTER